MDTKLKVGQWVDALEGIGQVLSLHDFFVEEFNPEIAEGKKVGDSLLTLCVYKMLCDFKGKVRKRNLVLSCNANMCKPICHDSRLVLDEIQNGKPEAYKKYSDFKSKKPLGEPVDIWLRLPVDQLDDLRNGIAIVNQKLDKPFTYIEFLEALKANGIDLDFTSMHKQDPVGSSDFIVSFFNKDYLVKDKRALFTDVRGVINL